MNDENFHGVYVASPERLIYYLNQNRSLKGFPMSKEPVTGTPLVFYFKKHSILTAPINKHLAFVLSGGIRSYLYLKYGDPKYLKLTVQKHSGILTLNQIQGIFEICGFLYILTILVFGLEVIWIKIKLPLIHHTRFNLWT